VKKILTLLSFLLACNVQAQTLQQGDRLQPVFTAMPQHYYFKAPSFTEWIEGKNMIMVCDNPKPTESKLLFLALGDSTLVGAYSSKAPVSFLLDASGDGILAAPTQYFLLPEWVVKSSGRSDASDKKIIALLDKLYEKTLQANDLQLDQKTMNEYQRYKTDTTLANRHIALLFDNYQTIINNTASEGKNAPPEICLPLMQQLSQECRLLYNNVPVIVCIYLGESLLNAGRKDDARAHFKVSLDQYPNSIPLMVYNYRLEQDPSKQKSMLEQLKKKYPRHWMVMDL